MKSKQKRITFTYFTFFVLITLGIVLATGAGSFITGYLVVGPESFGVIDTETRVGSCTTDTECGTGSFCSYQSRTPSATDRKVCLSRDILTGGSCVWNAQCRTSYCRRTTNTCAAGGESSNLLPRMKNDECSATTPCEHILYTCDSVAYSSLTYNICQEKTSLPAVPPVVPSPPATVATSVSVQAGSPRCVELKADSFPGTTSDPTFGTLWICRILPEVISDASTPITRPARDTYASRTSPARTVLPTPPSPSPAPPVVSCTNDNACKDALGSQYICSKTTAVAEFGICKIPTPPTVHTLSKTVPLRQLHTVGGPCTTVKGSEEQAELCLLKIDDEQTGVRMSITTQDTTLITEDFTLALNRPRIVKGIRITLEEITREPLVAHLAFTAPPLPSL
ncbi:MAG: hypothetical protein WC595_03890 [Candidatus Nanoarchaeia archaeon]